jgi:hypothetical protein
VERPETRAIMKERKSRARLEEINQAVAALACMKIFELPVTPKSVEEALAGPDAEHWKKGKDKVLKGISDRST